MVGIYQWLNIFLNLKLKTDIFSKRKLNFQKNILCIHICQCLFWINDLCIGCRLVKPSDLQTVSRAVHKKDQDNSVVSCESKCQTLFALSVSWKWLIYCYHIIIRVPSINLIFSFIIYWLIKHFGVWFKAPILKNSLIR